MASFADQLKSEIGSGLVVAMGEGDFAISPCCHCDKGSAGEPLRRRYFKTNHCPLYVKGRGGGQPRFAQGIVTDKEAFLKLEDLLLEELKKLTF